MSDQYTPTTKEVRDAWRNSTFDALDGTEFDRWLASVKAGAWETGALWAAAECGVIKPDCPLEQWLTPGDNPYREQETP